MNSEDSIKKLVHEFATNVVKQNESIFVHDPNRGNEHAREYIKAFRQLRAFGPKGLDALATLLDDERKDVRTMAACFLLRHKTEAALEVLKKSAEEKGLDGLGAFMTLKRWESGTWNLDSI